MPIRNVVIERCQIHCIFHKKNTILKATWLCENEKYSLVFKNILMLQFQGSNALIIPTNTSNKHAFYGVKGGGTPLRNWRDRGTSVA